MPTQKHEIKKGWLGFSAKAVNTDSRTIDVVASTSKLDRDHDIIRPSAFVESLAAFRANPVCLACHQHRLSSGSSPVIGSVIPDSISIDDTKVVMTIRFATTALGEEYWQLYRDSHMRAVSIGFIAHEWTDEKDEQLGYIRTYTKIELLELSAVPVPANPEALARMQAAGFFDGDATEIKELIETQLKSALDKITNLIEPLSERIEEIHTHIYGDSGELAEAYLLGDASDPLDRSAELKNAEQELERIRKSVSGE